MEGLSILDFPRLTWQADTTELLNQRYLLNTIYSYLHMHINTLHIHRYGSLKHLFLLRFQNTSRESLGVLCFCWKIVLIFICAQADWNEYLLEIITCIPGVEPSFPHIIKYAFSNSTYWWTKSGQWIILSWVFAVVLRRDDVYNSLVKWNTTGWLFTDSMKVSKVRLLLEGGQEVEQTGDLWSLFPLFQDFAASLCPPAINIPTRWLPKWKNLFSDFFF